MRWENLYVAGLGAYLPEQVYTAEQAVADGVYGAGECEANGYRGVRVAADDDAGDIFSRIVTERIEPKLGIGRPTILMEYPASQAALARRKPGDPRLSERFELYACGVELANAFGELTDPAEQRARFEADMAEKERRYGERYPIDEELLAALPTAGSAISRGA